MFVGKSKFFIFSSFYLFIERVAVMIVLTGHHKLNHNFLLYNESFLVLVVKKLPVKFLNKNNSFNV